MSSEIQMINSIASKGLRDIIGQSVDAAVTGPVLVRSDIPEGPVVLTPTRHYYCDGRLLAYEITDAQAFWALLRQAKAEHGDRGATVLLPAAEHFRNRRLFVSHDGMAVLALGNTEDTRGYLSSVCKSPKYPGSMTQLLQLAIQEGANHLFCFDTCLTAYYRRLGFRPVCRVSFEVFGEPCDWDREAYREYGPAGKAGCPDVNYFCYDPCQPLSCAADPVDVALASTDIPYASSLQQANDILKREVDRVLALQ
ncbi:hypothetical protein AWB68_08467 [Caballeronia choica]|uniref:Uncharacterized protein n=1 Tax=Caballeronia choica TaxID=326476 RepID=A0A158L4H7_9BURK|nr:GNAT family N-acetyltransferase [Caballeronia choica]SAL87601.1 hypothetical protein AWB68_08467 [Caballeronia choica]